MSTSDADDKAKDRVDAATAVDLPQLVRPTRLPIPRPKVDQILIKVSTCGVCHTELDEIEGRIEPPSLPIVPGHQVVGYVVEVGEGVSMHADQALRQLKAGGVRGSFVLQIDGKNGAL